MRGASITHRGRHDVTKWQAVCRNRNRCVRLSCWSSLAVGLVFGLVSRPVDASYASAAVARELVHQLQNRSVTVFAAVDPKDPSRFVAVRNVYGQALFLISARPRSSAVVAAHINSRAYGEVYVELLRAKVPRRFFVQDANADGLLHALSGSGSVDIVRAGGSTIRFNSNPGSQGLTDAQYRSAFQSLDLRYAEALGILMVALEQGSAKERDPQPVTVRK
jgi:hypothetical protein